MSTITSTAHAPRFGALYSLYIDSAQAGELETSLNEKAKTDGVNACAAFKDDFHKEIGYPGCSDLASVEVATGKLDRTLNFMTHCWEKMELGFKRLLIKPWAKPLMASGLGDSAKKVIYTIGAYTTLAASFMLLWPLKLGFLAVKFPLVITAKAIPLLLALPVLSPLKRLMGYGSDQKATSDGDLVLDILKNPDSPYKFDLASGVLKYKADDRPVTEASLQKDAGTSPEAN